MPSDLSYWLIAAPLKDGDSDATVQDVKRAVGDDAVVGGYEIPELKAGTLSSLLTLSDQLPKLDGSFTSVVSKLLDTLRSLVEDPSKLGQHARVNDRSAEEYLLPGDGKGWTWDAGRWGSGGKVGELVEALTKEINAIESVQKQKQQAYGLAKGSLTNLQRKRIGNLSQRSLLDVIKKGDLVEDSEFLETLVVAVPKNLAKDWEDKYERLTSMVVPQSTKRLAEDDEFVLQTVTLFKKVKDEFIHKSRENKFIVREFDWDPEALEKQNKEIADLGVEEKELWADLLKLTRVNFSEAYQILAHLKCIRLFVESVLRYGLPADYAGVIVRPEPKTAVKTLRALSAEFVYLARASGGPQRTKGKGSSGATEDIQGEWASVMEAEYYDFVLYEIPKVEF